MVDVTVTQAPTPEIIRRGTRLQSGMIGKLGTGTFIWPVPGYKSISRWAILPASIAVWILRPPTEPPSMPPTAAP